MNDLDFNSDIKQFSTNYKEKLCIQDTVLNLELEGYNNKGTIEVINRWQLCLSYLGKGNLLESKDASSIIYCLLTDACLLRTVNDSKVGLDIYNPIVSRFYQIECVTKKNRSVKLKIFPICNTMIIFDWQNYPEYKIYELFNLDQVKEYYGKKKVVWDQIIKDINLKPKFCGHSSTLDEDLKRLSIDNIIKNKDREKSIQILEDFMKQCKILEKQIQLEYKNLYLV